MTRQADRRNRRWTERSQHQLSLRTDTDTGSSGCRPEPSPDQVCAGSRVLISDRRRCEEHFLRLCLEHHLFDRFSTCMRTCMSGRAIRDVRSELGSHPWVLPTHHGLERLRRQTAASTADSDLQHIEEEP